MAKSTIFTELVLKNLPQKSRFKIHSVLNDIGRNVLIKL